MAVKEMSELKRHLVTSGNFSFVPTGTPLYKVIRKGDLSYKHYNVAPGRPVMWVDKDNCGEVPTAIAPVDLTEADFSHIRIAVGHSTKGNGISDALRSLSPTKIQGCTIDQLEVMAPQCAIPEIKAVYPGCVSCDTTSAIVKVYDNASISFANNQTKNYQDFFGSYTPDCATCNGCDKEVTCDEIICGLVDSLNNDVDTKINGLPYPHTPMGLKVKRPYVAFKIWPTWKSYCISPNVGEGCTECNSITALTTYTVNGKTFDFALTDPSDDTKTLVDQLTVAVDMINSTIEEELGRHGGKAFLSRGQGKCCPLQLFVTTCDEGFAIDGLLECPDAINQFPDFVTTGYCKQCGSTEQTETPNCGLGVFAEPDVQECNCWELNQPQAFTGRYIEVDIVSSNSDLKTPKYSKKATLLSSQIASGYGSQVQYLEYAHNIDAYGYEGFDYDLGNSHTGWLGDMDKRSRARAAVTADCNKSYCRYYLRHKFQREKGAFSNPINIYQDGFIHVPQNDTVTKSDFNLLFKKIADYVPSACGGGLETVYCE